MEKEERERETDEEKKIECVGACVCVRERKEKREREIEVLTVSILSELVFSIHALIGSRMVRAEPIPPFTFVEQNGRRRGFYNKMVDMDMADTVLIQSRHSWNRMAVGGDSTIKW